MSVGPPCACNLIELALRWSPDNFVFLFRTTEQNDRRALKKSAKKAIAKKKAAKKGRLMA